MRRKNPLSVRVKAPSRGLVTRWPTDTADKLSDADMKRVCVVAENVRFEDGVIAAAPGYERVGVDSLFAGLLAHWKFNETTGTREDAFASNDLSPGSAISSAAGKIGNAAVFTGVVDSILDRVTTSAVPGDIDFTVSGWFKVGSAPSSFSPDTLLAVGAFAWISVDTTPSLKLKFHFKYRNGASVSIVVATCSTVLSTGVWYFLRAWHDKTNRTIKLRVDEAGEDSIAYVGIPFVPASPDTSITFGQGAPAFNDYFTGSLDSFSIWGRLLSGAEVTRLYNAGAGLDYPFSIIDSAINRIHQSDLIASDSTPLFLCTAGKIFTAVRSFQSSPRQFYVTPTEIFPSGGTPSTASLLKPWGAVDFFDKVIFAQRTSLPQYWKQSFSATAVLPGLPAAGVYDGVESFQNHLLLWKDETLKWSDLNDFSNWIPVAETIASLRLTLSASFTQPTVGSATGLLPVTESPAGLTVGQYVRIDDGTNYNFYLVNAVSPAAGLSATLVAGGSQTITGSATSQIFILQAVLWEAGQRVVSSVDTTKILTVDSASPDSLASFSLSDASPVLPAVGTTFDILLVDLKTDLKPGDTISLGAYAVPSLDLFEITAVGTDDTTPMEFKTKLTIKQKNLGSSILAVGSSYPAGTSVVKQPWVKLIKSDAGNITATASSTLSERYAVNLTLQDLTGHTATASTIAVAKVIVTLDANEAGEVQNVGSNINGPIFQIVQMGEVAYILKHNSIQSVQYVGRLSGTFFIRSELSNEGLIGRNSFVKLDNGRLAFLGQRELYLYQGGPQPQPVAMQYTRQLFAELDRARLDEIFLHHKSLRNELWVVYPSNNSTVRVLIYNYIENTVSIDNYSAALQKLSAAETVDWNIDVSWESLPSDLTWTFEGEHQNRSWTGFGSVGVERVTLLASQETDGFSLLLHGYRFSRDGAGYTTLAETMDYDLDDDTAFKYPEVVHVGLQVRAPEETDRLVYLQVGTKTALDGEIQWSPAKTINVKGNYSDTVKINPVVRGGRFVRLRITSTDADVAWRVSFFEIFCRAGNTY